MINLFTPNDEKLKELILYIALKCECDPNFGAIKLNKILFYSDFEAYAQTGMPITGQEYQRLERGPAPRRLMPLRRALQADGSLEIVKQQVGGRERHKHVTKRDPDLSGFSGREISIVDATIDMLWNENGHSVSEMSHQTIGWRVTQDSETIPYQTALVGAPVLSSAAIEYGMSLVGMAREVLY